VKCVSGDLEDPVADHLLDPPAGVLEAPGDEVAEGLGGDRPQLELLGAAPERLVRVVEDPLHHVALAAEVEVRDLGLLLQHRAQELGELRVELDDLLELVEDQQRAALALGGDLGDELEQALERRIDVLRLVAGGEAEAQRAGVRVDCHRRHDPQPAEDARAEVLRARERSRDVVVDRRRELLGELLLRRRLHEVDLADEHAVADEALLDAVDERRLAEAPRREDHDVLAIAGVREQLRDLVVAVGERLVAGEGAEAERVGVGTAGHPPRGI
jgi:hypothetical protein